MNKKPFLILTGTIAGTVGVLSYAPSSQAIAPTLTKSVATVSSSASKSTATSTSAATSATAKKVLTRTVKGSVVQTQFGPVQVQVTLNGNKITTIKALQTPQGGRSSWINKQAVPYLVQQTLTAQSAAIQGVGGATYTTEGWITSLQSALSK
ncbi:MAG: FMN-binding protein [Actinomycetes bacterium]